MGVFNFLGATSSGWLTDRFNNYNLLAIYYGFRGLSLVYLPYDSLDAFSPHYGRFFWVRLYSNHPPTACLSAGFFGKIDGPIAFAWIFASHQLGAAAAAYGAGETGCYFELWPDFRDSRDRMFHGHRLIGCLQKL